MDYLNGIFANVSKNVTREEEVVVYAPDFLKDMVALVQKTPKRHLCFWFYFLIYTLNQHGISLVIFPSHFTER